MAWYLYPAFLLLLAYVFGAGISVGKRYPYLIKFIDSSHPVMEHNDIKVLSEQILRQLAPNRRLCTQA